MTRSSDRLYELLPVVHRQRDSDLGEPLRALLQVIAEQVDVVEADIERLYENWFIETCEDWVVPYIGDLVGYTPVHDLGQPGDVDSARVRRLHRILVPRREVANTLRYRRRKGTLALLEQLAHDVAGWPARAVEFYRLLAWTQALNHQRLHRGRTADLRDGDALDALGGPFDALAHTVDVRRLESCRTPGRYNIPGVGLFVWRLGAQAVTRAPAYCVESAGAHCYTFSVLGNDAPLFTKATPESSPHDIAGPLNVPAPIRRRALERGLDDYYGPGKSLAVWVDGWADHTADEPLTSDALIVADLTDWRYRPPRGKVALDPVLGRLAFPPRQLPKHGVRVSYHYGFGDRTGGGEYERTLSQPDGAVVYRVGHDAEFTRIGDALVRWRADEPRHAVVELIDGGVYVEQINLELAEGQSFQLRAANRVRPVVRLMDWQTARPDALWVQGDRGSRFTLDGVLVAGRSVHCEGPLDQVVIRHCTLVPGWSIEGDARPHRPAEPSLELTDTHARVAVERTILGSIQVSQDEVGSDPVPIRVSDSVLDATASEREAVGAPTWPLAHAVLTIERTTVFGEVQVHAIELAENSIFTGYVHVARRQHGCMRFCYVPPGSRTPRRYRCQPDLAERTVRDAIPRNEVHAEASASFVVGGSEAPTDPCLALPGPANLELAFEVSDAAPAVGDEIVLTLTVRNQGPRDATGLEITVAGPPDDCLDLQELGTSQGTFEGDDRWSVGSLRAGACATLRARVVVTGTCDPAPAATTVHAALTAYTFVGDGSAFLGEHIGRARRRVRPRFNSTRYGAPDYAQLALSCEEAITRGADDESEMGAFHDLYQPQRAANLRTRLDEFMPGGMDAGIIYVS